VGSIIPAVFSGSGLFGTARDLLQNTRDEKTKKVVLTSILCRYDHGRLKGSGAYTSSFSFHSIKIT
jgi:hypothetical protein